MSSLLALDYESARWTDNPVDMAAPLFHSVEFLHIPPALFNELTKSQMRAHSMAEAAHFFSINILGEHYGISTMEKTPEDFFAAHDLLNYRDRLLDEEKRHTSVFVKMSENMGVTPPATAHIFGQPTALQSLADAVEFFGNIFIFEFVTTAVSAKVMADPLVEATTRSVHKFHWADERHHLRQTRILLETLAKKLTEGERTILLKRAKDWSDILARTLFPTAAIRQLEAASGKRLMDVAYNYAKNESAYRELFASAYSTLQRTQFP